MDVDKLLVRKAYHYSNAKAYVFAASVIYFGKIGDDPIESWKRQIQWYSEKQPLQRDESHRRHAGGVRVQNIPRNHNVGPHRADSLTNGSF